MVPVNPGPAFGELFRRALRLRCPACGRGRVFREGFARAASCGSCRRRLDPDEGHWLGGAEIHMVLTFGGSAAAAFPLVALCDLPGAAIAGILLAHVAGSVALYRHSRALFLALDYAVDPGEPPAGGGAREGRRDPDRPSTPRPRGPRRRRRARRAVGASA